MRTGMPAARGTGRWKKGGTRYPDTDPRKPLLTIIARARTADGWRNGARVVKR